MASGLNPGADGLRVAPEGARSVGHQIRLGCGGLHCLCGPSRLRSRAAVSDVLDRPAKLRFMLRER